MTVPGVVENILCKPGELTELPGTGYFERDPLLLVPGPKTKRLPTRTLQAPGSPPPEPPSGGTHIVGRL